MRATVWRAAARVGDLAIVGLMCAVGSLPMLSFPVALSAAAAASRETDLASAVRTYLRTYRRCALPGLMYGLLLTAASVGAGGAALTARTATWAGMLLCVTSAAIYACLSVATVYLAAAMEGGEMGATRLPVLTIMLALVTPRVALLSAVASLSFIAACLLLPVAGVLVLGYMAKLVARVELEVAARLVDPALRLNDIDQEKELA